MSKRQLLCLLGIWVALFLFLGIPSSYDKIIAVVTGLVIAGISYTLSGPSSSSTSTPKETFIENKQP